MANVLRLIGCCFLSMLFVLELSAWLIGFGINLPLFVVCSIALAVLIIYTVYDILTIKEDNEFLQDRCKNVERMYTDVNIERNNLMIENEQLDSMYKQQNRTVQEYERKIGELVNRLNRLETSIEEG